MLQSSSTGYTKHHFRLRRARPPIRVTQQNATFSPLVALRDGKVTLKCMLCHKRACYVTKQISEGELVIKQAL